MKMCIANINIVFIRKSNPIMTRGKFYEDPRITQKIGTKRTMPNLEKNYNSNTKLLQKF